MSASCQPHGTDLSRRSLFHINVSIHPKFSRSLGLFGGTYRNSYQRTPVAPWGSCISLNHRGHTCRQDAVRNGPMFSRTQLGLGSSRKAGGRRPGRSQTSILAGPAVAASASKPLMTSFANALGYAVFAVACIRGFPQIAKILRAKSAEGVSLLANVVETLCYTTVYFYHARHGYPFLAYGELLVLLLQNAILIALILYYTKRLRRWQSAVGVAAYSSFVWALASGFIPMRLLTLMQASVIFVIGLGSRVPQIRMNMRRGNSGQLSSTTCLINLTGNVTRLFTTIVLMGDRLVMGANISQGILNSILLYQTVMTKVRNRRAAAVATPSAAT
eukprot:jgi/Botrbrau1/11983/Bobra.0115s0019.1